ncbi:hypothetical protein [Mycobacterium sp. C31M]
MTVVLVTGPAWSGVSRLVGALQTALPGWTVAESVDGPDVVVFAVSAAAPLVGSDLAVLDRAAAGTDLLIGAVTKTDVHEDWRQVRAVDAAAAGQHAARYRTMRWVGVAAAPPEGAPALADLIAMLTDMVADPQRERRNQLRANATRLCAQIAEASATDLVAAGLHRRRDDALRGARQRRDVQARTLRSRLQQARTEFGHLARHGCTALRLELTEDAAGRWRSATFVTHAADRVTQVITEVDDAVTVGLQGVADDLGLAPPPDPGPPTTPDLGTPGVTSRRLELQLMALLGAGFGLGVALAAGRLLADLAPGAAVLGGGLGLLLTAWVIGIRGLLHDRAQRERWISAVFAVLRDDLDARVATRLSAAEAHFGAECARRAEDDIRRTAAQVAAIDAQIRARAVTAAATATAARGRLSSARAALRDVQMELNRYNCE